MVKLIVLIGLVCMLSGCAGIPIRDGELAIGKDTTASIEDIGAVRVTNRY